MTTSGRGRVLWHGTTRKRAEAILRNGPDPDFLEPGGFEKAGGFSTAPPHGPYSSSNPRSVADAKSALFPDEGGPAILELEIPEEFIALAIDVVEEVRFELGFGLQELRDAWASVPKGIL